MLLKDDKKRMATIIVGKLSGKPESMEEKPKNEMGDEMDSEMGLDAAAEELLSAMHSKDPKMLKHALRSFMEMIMNEMPEESSSHDYPSEK